MERCDQPTAVLRHPHAGLDGPQYVPSFAIPIRCRFANSYLIY
jgi:hypothetical protein